jgi:hypothetical protein
VNDSLNLDFHYNMKILLIIDARENRRGIQDIWNKSNKIEEEFKIYVVESGIKHDNHNPSHYRT